MIHDIIELKGRRYDARTGKPLEGPLTKTHQPNSSLNSDARKHTKPSTGTKAAAARSHTPKHHSSRHPVQSSRTLMRQAVKKPAPSLKRQLKVHARTDLLVHQPQLTLATKLSISALDAKRLKYAARIPKSRSISRFGPIRPILVTYVAPQPQPRPVAPTNNAQPTNVRVAPAAKPLHPRTTDELLQQALERATSHQQKPLPKKRRLRLFHAH